MKITLLMNHDIASNLALNLLAEPLADHDLTVFVSERHGRAKGPVPHALQYLRFVEQSLFNELLFPLLDGEGRRGELATFAALGAQFGRPVRALSRINSPQGLALLRASEPDLIVSMRYGGFLEEAAIAIAAHGILNLHAGLLPQYQGLMATFRAMLDGAQEYGCTLHYIVDRGIDTGPVVAQCRLPIDPRHSYFWHVVNLYPPACKAVCDAVAEIARHGRTPSTAQAGPGHYYSLPGSDELQRFEAMGLTLVDPEDVVALAGRYAAPLVAGEDAADANRE